MTRTLKNRSKKGMITDTLMRPASKAMVRGGNSLAAAGAASQRPRRRKQGKRENLAGQCAH